MESVGESAVAPVPDTKQEQSWNYMTNAPNCDYGFPSTQISKLGLKSVSAPRQMNAGCSSRRSQINHSHTVLDTKALRKG